MSESPAARPGPVPPGGLVCVTGANGYVGSYIVGDLLAGGWRVRAGVRDPDDPGKTDHLRALAERHGAADRLSFARADLYDRAALTEAFRGCDGVVHAAAAVFFAAKDPQREIVDPSVEGTKNVLEALRAAGGVRRLVHTSSVTAIYRFDRAPDYRFTESDWNETSELETDPYGLAKVTAERTARGFVDALPEAERFELVHLNPGLVWGPPIIKKHVKASPRFVRDLVSGALPGCPAMHFAIVDVRDVSAAHVAALTAPDAGGRYLLVADHLWVHEVAARLQAAFPGQKVTTRRVPNIGVLLASLFDASLHTRQLTKLLGRSMFYDSGRAERELGVSFRPIDDTIRETAEIMLEQGWARKNPR